MISGLHFQVRRKMCVNLTINAHVFLHPPQTLRQRPPQESSKDAAAEDNYQSHRPNEADAHSDQ